MNKFGDALKKEREILGITLRALGKEAGVNHGYLSKLEAGDIQPRVKNVLRIADALSKLASKGSDDEDVFAKQAFRKRLLEAAEMEEFAPSVEKEIRDRFAQLLKKRGLQAHQIREALKKVATVSMQRVLTGEEDLGILSASTYTGSAREQYLDQEVVALSDFEHRFSTGRRGEIKINGEITPAQHAQLETIAKLIGQMLEPE